MYIYMYDMYVYIYIYNIITYVYIYIYSGGGVYILYTIVVIIYATLYNQLIFAVTGFRYTADPAGLVRQEPCRHCRSRRPLAREQHPF